MPVELQIVDGIDDQVRRDVGIACRALGLPAPVRWGTVERCTCPQKPCATNLNCGVAMMPEGYGLCCGVEFPTFFSPEERFGIICHELGHVKHGDLERAVFRMAIKSDMSQAELWETEYKADKFAVECGTGRGLLKSFERTVHFDPTPWIGSKEHPPLTDRIERLRELLGIRVMRAAA